jgi:hypothetical protein
MTEMLTNQKKNKSNAEDAEEDKGVGGDDIVG